MRRVQSCPRGRVPLACVGLPMQPKEYGLGVAGHQRTEVEPAGAGDPQCGAVASPPSVPPETGQTAALGAAGRDGSLGNRIPLEPGS